MSPLAPATLVLAWALTAVFTALPVVVEVPGRERGPRLVGRLALITVACVAFLVAVVLTVNLSQKFFVNWSEIPHLFN